MENRKNIDNSILLPQYYKKWKPCGTAHRLQQYLYRKQFNMLEEMKHINNPNKTITLTDFFFPAEMSVFVLTVKTSSLNT